MILITPMADDLRSLRAQLTACDEQIVASLAERMRLIPNDWAARVLSRTATIARPVRLLRRDQTEAITTIATIRTK